MMVERLSSAALGSPNSLYALKTVLEKPNFRPLFQIFASSSEEPAGDGLLLDENFDKQNSPNKSSKAAGAPDTLSGGRGDPCGPTGLNRDSHAKRILTFYSF